MEPFGFIFGMLLCIDSDSRAGRYKDPPLTTLDKIVVWGCGLIVIAFVIWLHWG